MTQHTEPESRDEKTVAKEGWQRKIYTERDQIRLAPMWGFINIERTLVTGRGSFLGDIPATRAWRVFRRVYDGAIVLDYLPPKNHSPSKKQPA